MSKIHAATGKTRIRHVPTSPHPMATKEGLGRTSPDQPQEREYDLEDRLLEFAARIVRLTESFPNTRAGTHVAKQLLRSGTAALPNHGEAQAAESTNDFTHKMSICLKELRETIRWLKLSQRIPLCEPSRLDELIAETDELVTIFYTSIRTANTKGNR